MHLNAKDLCLTILMRVLHLLSLKEDARRWLKTYGSSAIDNLNFRDSFILIGQKGLKEGHAIEYVSSVLFSLLIYEVGLETFSFWLTRKG